VIGSSIESMLNSLFPSRAISHRCFNSRLLSLITKIPENIHQVSPEWNVLYCTQKHKTHHLHYHSLNTPCHTGLWHLILRWNC
jgi:hypothetical protein